MKTCTKATHIPYSAQMMSESEIDMFCRYHHLIRYSVVSNLQQFSGCSSRMKLTSNAIADQQRPCLLATCQLCLVCTNECIRLYIIFVCTEHYEHIIVPGILVEYGFKFTLPPSTI